MIKRLLMLAGFIMFAAAPLATVLAPQTASAAPTDPPDSCYRSLLGMPTWYRGLNDGDCNLVGPETTNPATGETLDLPGFIWRIALNVIEIGLFIAGFIAVFFLMYGGFQFMTGGSNPGQIEKARVTMLNAVIGLAISMGAIGITNLIFRIING